jgi:hypothetical protein
VREAFSNGLSQKPTASALTRFALSTILLLAVVTLVCGAVTVGIWWLLLSLLGTGGGLLVGGCVLVAAIVAAAFTVQRVAVHLVGRKPIGASLWVGLAVPALVVVLLTGGLSAPVGILAALFVGRRRRRTWTGTI